MVVRMTLGLLCWPSLGSRSCNPTDIRGIGIFECFLNLSFETTTNIFTAKQKNYSKAEKLGHVWTMREHERNFEKF